MLLPNTAIVPEGEYGTLSKTEDGWNISYGTEVVHLPELPDGKTLGLDTYRVQGLPGGNARIITYADLHRHSDGSLKDGVTQIPQMVKKTEYAGALTDHGNMYNFLDCYREMKKAGKKPIIGVEAYMEDMEGQLTRNHIILLAKNLTGYKNLIKLTSKSFQKENFKAQCPHVTWAMLEDHHEGIICLTACLSGLLAKSLMADDAQQSKAIIERFISIFGKDDFYIEIQNHGIPAEDDIRPKLVGLAKKYGLEYVASTDAHYAEPEDKEVHEAILALARGKTLYSDDRPKYDGEGYWLHTSEEMEERFAQYPEALDTSLKIADKCDLEIPLGDVNLPKYKIPAPFKSPDTYMEHLVREGFKTRFQGTDHLTDQTYLDRLDYEINMIKQMGFPSYFIIVWDFINFARSRNIYVGPGRGSAAGSLAAYCMGITDVDPVRWNLLFERFLNPERVSYPDIDTDIESRGRPIVIQYMRQKYGENSLCRIITFGTYAARRAILDMAKVLGCPVSFGTKLAKCVPKVPDITIKAAMEQSYELAVYYKTDVTAKHVIDLAMKIEGGKRNASAHACGIAIAPGEMSDFMPTAMTEDSETGELVLTSQVTDIEPLSIIKMDLLGLRNLDVIHICLDAAQRNYGKEAILERLQSKNTEVRYQDIPLGDRETYQMIRSGTTGGVFQFEGKGITKLVTDILYDLDSVTQEELDGGAMFERMVSANALYRPGPMDYIPEYISGLKDRSKVSYDCPAEEDILKSTFGVLVYQEQLMHIAQKLAGYTLGRADVIRKGAAKKKTDILAAEREVFIRGNKAAFDSGKDKNYAPGCVQNGIAEQVAVHIWDKMEKFGHYAFNRSHSVCYSFLGYITAYLSCHFPTEFYSALLTTFIDRPDKRRVYLAQATRRGIELVLPDVQRSTCDYTTDDGKILFGLQGISGLKAQAVAIVEEREENGSYEDLNDLYNRLAQKGTRLDKTSIEGLIYAGALRAFSKNKAALWEQFKRIEQDYKANADMREMGQLSLFSPEEQKVPLSEVSPLPAAEEQKKEFETLGIYLSKHPSSRYNKGMAQRYDYTSVDTLAAQSETKKGVKTMGLVTDFKEFSTKSNKLMATFTLESKFSVLRCVIFPEAFAEIRGKVTNGAVLCFGGDIIEDRRHEDEMQFSVSSVMNPDVEFQRSLRGIIVDVGDRAEQERVRAYVKAHPGYGTVSLRACGKLFPLSSGVDDSLKHLEVMAQLFKCEILEGGQ